MAGERRLVCLVHRARQPPAVAVALAAERLLLAEVPVGPPEPLTDSCQAARSAVTVSAVRH